MNAHELDRSVDLICRRAADIAGDVRQVVIDEVDRVAPLADSRERDALIGRAVSRLDGLDALDEVLADPAVDEVMVNAGRLVWVDRDGTLSRAADLAPGAIDVVLERVLAPLGKRLDRTNPIVDARLPDGARICAVVEPIALDGTAVSIRRHRSTRVGLSSFAPTSVVDVIAELVRARANVLITGATSSGKTTLLAAMTELVDPGERIVVIEDTAELALGDSRHAIRLEARPSGVDGVPPIDLSHLVRTAMRLRPDRLVLGEFRGPEVVAVIEALNTGHDGSLSTCHANSAIDGLRRIETLVMQAAPAWPLAAIRRQVSRSLDAVVHVARTADGRRSIHEIVEVVETDDEPTGTPIVSAGRPVGRLTRGRR